MKQFESSLSAHCYKLAAEGHGVLLRSCVHSTHRASPGKYHTSGGHRGEKGVDLYLSASLVLFPLVLEGS